MTRNRAPVTPPVVLTIAGSDSGGGAGIQADLKTIEASGAFGTSAVTSVTAQNTTGVESTHVLPVEEVEAQCRAVRSDFDVSAVKTGMLATSDVVDLVTDQVAATAAPAVVDPVMVAASGDRLLEPEAEDAYERLVAEATLVTPNADEAAVLTGVDVTDPSRAREAGAALVEMGAEAALVKGGHVPGDEVADVLVTPEDEETLRHLEAINGVGPNRATPEDEETLRHPRVETEATHGSGCTLSSAVAARLAGGDDLSTAVERGVDLLARAVRYGLEVGEGPGAVHHMVDLRDRAERQPTVERVAETVRQFLARDVSPLVPEVGMNVVGATPYAESPADCAAVEGRLSRTPDGVASAGRIRVGASGHVARFLLAAREHDADLRFATNCRFDDDIDAALDTLQGPVVSYDRADDAEGREGRESRTPEFGARRAFETTEETPVAVFDHSSAGRAPMVRLLARSSAALVGRTVTLLDALSDEE